MEKAKRKPISKKIRFEVFKRDSFTCQYCGNKAPDVILEVDHINPVSKGGSSDVMNLVTSCFNCNRGKSDRRLSDNSVIEKQRIQIQELNLRRQQLEMMLNWRDELKTFEEDKFKVVFDYWEDKLDCTLTDHGMKLFRKMIKKHGINNVLDAIDISIERYFKSEEDIETVFSKMNGILNLKNEPDHIKKMAYIRGICKNKFSYFNEQKSWVILKDWYANDSFADLDTLQELLVSGEIRTWSEFVTYLGIYTEA